MTGQELRIGEAAAMVGVSTRTLRYYEELGLLRPTGRSPGGARRYSQADVAALLRIRELQEVMGFDLQEIRRIVAAEARLQELRAEFKAGASQTRQEQLIDEAIKINAELRADVRARLERIERFQADLERKAARYRDFRKSMASDATRANVPAAVLP